MTDEGHTIDVGPVTVGSALPEAEWVGPSMVLIESDADVSVSARTLTSLVSYALAGPSNDASTRLRDEAVDQAHRAIAASYLSQFGGDA